MRSDKAKWKVFWVLDRAHLEPVTIRPVIDFCDCRYIDGTMDMSILKTTMLTTDDITDSWKTYWKWHEIVRLLLNYNAEVIPN